MLCQSRRFISAHDLLTIGNWKHAYGEGEGHWRRHGAKMEGEAMLFIMPVVQRHRLGGVTDTTPCKIVFFCYVCDFHVSKMAANWLSVCDVSIENLACI